MIKNRRTYFIHQLRKCENLSKLSKNIQDAYHISEMKKMETFCQESWPIRLEKKRKSLEALAVDVGVAGEAELANCVTRKRDE